MHNTFETYQAEIEYRANRIRKDMGRRRRVRSPFVRKPAPSRTTR
jgi:hypothetical protein